MYGDIPRCQTRPAGLIPKFFFTLELLFMTILMKKKFACAFCIFGCDAFAHVSWNSNEKSNKLLHLARERLRQHTDAMCCVLIKLMASLKHKRPEECVTLFVCSSVSR